MTKITSLSKLAHLADITKNDNGVEVKMLLNGGIYSHKQIWYDPDQEIFEIYNSIDDSEIEVSFSEIMDTSITLVGEAIKKGALYAY